MPLYRCFLLREDGQVGTIEDLNCYDDGEASRDASHLLNGKYSGFELWRDGRKVDEFRPVKPAPAPQD
jgi:hypothetical protein